MVNCQICTHIHIFTFKCLTYLTSTQSHTQAHARKHTPARTHTHTCICLHVCVFVCVCTCLCMCLCMCVCVRRFRHCLDKIKNKQTYYQNPLSFSCQNRSVTSDKCSCAAKTMSEKYDKKTRSSSGNTKSCTFKRFGRVT